MIYTKEQYDQMSDALNQIAVIVDNCPYLDYQILGVMEEDEIPEGANLEYGINTAAEIEVYRKDIYK